MIRNIQGSTVKAAANRFSQEPENIMHFINKGTHVVTFKYHEDDPYYLKPAPGKITEFVHLSWDERVQQNLCPDINGGNGTTFLSSSQRMALETEFSINLADYNSVFALFELLENGGNTTAELLDIEAAIPDDMWDLRSQLLGDSPHLSLEVLMAMSDRTDVLPDNAIFDILAANPDELKKDTLISYLENKEDPLPDYMINILKQLAYTNTTYKTILLDDLETYYGQKMQSAKSIIHSMLHDSIVDQTDYRNWLDNMTCLSADKQIIASYLSEGDTTNAFQLLNIIPSFYELSGDELVDFNSYKDLITLQISWKNQGKTIFELDSSDVIALENYAYNTTGSASYSAKNILSKALDYTFCDCLGSNDTAYMKSTDINIEISDDESFGIDINVNPNPANTWAVFNYRMCTDKSVGFISISDISGKEIKKFNISGKYGQQIWDTRGVKPGVYIYMYYSDNYSKSGKLIIK